MAEHITIGATEPREQFTGDGEQTDFVYPFPIFENADLKVYVSSTLLSEGSDYDISGVGSAEGGTVSLYLAPANGVPVTLVRERAIARTSDFQEGGAFRAKVINDELDKITASLQEIALEAKRTIRLAATDETVSIELPVKADRINKVLSFDENGNMAAVTTDGFSGPQGPQGEPGDLSADGTFTLTNKTIDATQNTLTNIDAAACSIATQAQAEAGSDTTSLMTPERVSQAISAQAGYTVASQAQAEAGTDDTTLMTPERVSQAISAQGSGGSWEVVTNATAIASADYITVSGFSSGYDYLVSINAAETQTDSVLIKAQVSQSGTFLTGATDYVDEDGETTSLKLTRTAVGNGVREGLSGELLIPDPGGSDTKRIIPILSYGTPALTESNVGLAAGGRFNANSTAIDGIRIFPSTGQWRTAGTYLVMRRAR
ncbi:MAG: hypothetical protein ACPGOV_13335 [Magnetovibrionaceae bacterium]